LGFRGFGVSGFGVSGLGARRLGSGVWSLGLGPEKAFEVDQLAWPVQRERKREREIKRERERATERERERKKEREKEREILKISENKSLSFSLFAGLHTKDAGGRAPGSGCGDLRLKIRG